jgi:hypothetical protein
MAVIDIENIKTQDVVILEMRQIKDDLAKAFGYDIKKMLAEARIRQQASGRTIIAPPTKKNT